MVGAVVVGGLQVEVRPKQEVGLARLLFLLGYARDPGFRPDLVAGVEDAEIWPVLAETLARLGEAALARGVLQGYRVEEDALRVVRGRIRMGDQLARRPGLSVPLEVTFDEYTVDIAENRILRTALRRLLALPRVRAATRARLGHLDARLEGAGILPVRGKVPEWRATRLNERYHSALQFAELVLRAVSVDVGIGAVPLAAFVVPMWRVFEDFVGVALAEALRRYGGETRLAPRQFGTWFDEPVAGQRGVRMSLDVVHMVDGQPRLVFDAKYKVADPSGRYPNADLYQMLAYCTVLGVRRAWLVYAAGGKPVERVVRKTDVRITEYPLDLGLRPAELLDKVGELASQAWRRSFQSTY
jgi:5-methylcytosine-specific restriction enzyme subunit McrC